MKTATHSFELGDFQCFVIRDVSRAFAAEDLIANADPQGLEQLALRLGFAPDQIPVDNLCLLVDTGDQKVLIDAGYGDRLEGIHSQLRQGLASLGVAPADVDAVAITHADLDHIAGILDREDRLAFPNARYFILRQAWEFWSSPDKRSMVVKQHEWHEELVEFIWNTYARIEGLTTLVESGEEFLPGLRLVSAFGHRYDHAVVQIASLGEKLLHAGDGVVHPLFIARPDWYSTYDTLPEQALATKRQWLDWCASQGALLFASHFPFPGLGRVHKLEDGWRWQPL